MKTLSYVVILLLSFAAPGRAAPVYSGCAAPPSGARPSGSRTRATGSGPRAPPRHEYPVCFVHRVAYGSVGGPVGGKVGSDLGASPTLSAPATRGPYGLPAPVGRPAGYASAVTPGQVVPQNVQVMPQPGGVVQPSSMVTACSSIPQIASCGSSISDTRAHDRTQAL